MQEQKDDPMVCEVQEQVNNPMLFACKANAAQPGGRM